MTGQLAVDTHGYAADALRVAALERMTSMTPHRCRLAPALLPLLVPLAAVAGCGREVSIGLGYDDAGNAGSHIDAPGPAPDAVPSTEAGGEAAPPVVCAPTTPAILTTVAANQRLINIATFAGYLYFNTGDSANGGLLARIAPPSGPVETVFAGLVGDFAASSTDVAWSPAIATTTGGTTTFSYTHVDVSTPRGQTTLGGPPDTVGPIAVDDAGNVFWRWDIPLMDPPATSTLERWDALQGAMTSLYLGPGFNFALDGDVIFLFTTVANTIQTDVLSMPATGGATTSVGTFPANLQTVFIGLDATNLYFVGFTPPPMPVLDAPPAPFTLYSLPKAGGTPTLTYTSPDAYNNPTSFHVDDTSFYWADSVHLSSTSMVYRAPKAGNQPATLLRTSPRLISQVAVDACNVYWMEGTAEVWVMGK